MYLGEPTQMVVKKVVRPIAKLSEEAHCNESNGSRPRQMPYVCHMCLAAEWARLGLGSLPHCFDDFAMMRPMLGIGKRVVRYPPTNDHQGFSRPHWRTSGGVSSNDASVAENRQITYGARVGTSWDAS